MIETFFWVLGTLWWLLKVLFWCGLAATLLGTLLALFHPLTFSVKLRASPLAQRGQFWFTYFFGLLGVGTRASLQHQYVIVRFWKWERRVYHRGPEKNAAPPDTPAASGPKKPSGPSDPLPGSSTPADSFGTPSGSVAAAASSAPINPEAPVAGVSPRAGSDAQPSKTVDKATIAGVPVSPSASDGPSSVPGAIPPATPAETLPPAASAVDPIAVQPPVAPETPPAMSPTSAPAKPAILSAPTAVSAPSVPVIEEATPETTSPAVDWDVLDEEFDEIPAEALQPPSPKPGFWSKVKALPKKARDLFRRLKRGFRIARTFWRRFSPPVQQLLWDLWETFSLRGPHARLRYGCQEPHLVGMFQGLACQIAGILWPFGLHWHFVPVFQSNTLLLHGEMAMIIHPWKILRSSVAFLLEPEMRKGIVELWKWYRARKARRGNESADSS